MRVLIVGRYKEQFPEHLLPFVLEQGEALRAQGVDVEYYAHRGSYFSTRSLRKKIDECGPDIVHAHYGLSGITAALQCKVPFVTTFHNGETLSKAVNFVSSFFSLRAGHVIYVAQHIYDKLIFKRCGKHSIIPCGVTLADCDIIDYAEARAELGFEPGKKYVLFGGAFDNARKNFPLLKAAVDLLDDCPIVCKEMKGLSRAAVTRLMCACDAFVLPSFSEGSPQALKEAMCCNCPVICTDIADVRQIIGETPGHFICSYDPSDLAEKLKLAFAFPGRTEGRERIISLGLTNDIVAKRLIDIYNSVLK